MVLTVALLAIVSLAGCTTPLADPPAAVSGPSATTSAAASTSSPVQFTGDLLSLFAAAPPNRAVTTPAASADLPSTARYFSASPEPISKRLGELGFRQGAVIGWQLSQGNHLLVNIFQLADESAARQWVTEQRQSWSGHPHDDQTFAALNLSADFDSGVHGGWLVGFPIDSEELGRVRQVKAVFYRHDLVVHLSFTGTQDSHLQAVAAFADDQFARLP